MDLAEVGRRLLPRAVRPIARRPLVRYRSLGLRPADVLLVSYPKSGSTWLRFLLAHALTGTEADFDSIRDTIPPVGRHRRAPALLPGGGRLVRTHEPLRPGGRSRSLRRVGLGPRRGEEGGPAGCPPGEETQPVLYLVRDGRAVAMSYFHHLRREGRYTGDFTGFLDAFLRGHLDGYGPWHQHVMSALTSEAPVRERFLVMRYEDLRTDPEAQVSRALAFLGREPDQELISLAVASSNKERMRAKEATSTFLAGRPTDGSPVVRSDRAYEWAGLVPSDARRRFAAVCRAALEAAGYAV